MNPKQKNFEFKSDEEDGPVECLGMSFENDAARREYFTDKLREKLKDPEFRKIEGFPIGEDEDILALSDPPYYTACPNPFFGDFIKLYGKPFNARDKYHREPFAADVKEGKNDSIYNVHSYHTKVPHKAIMRYILHYTEPGDIVFDGFCGTGMTGIAAYHCGDQKSVQQLGYQVKKDGSILNSEGKPFSKLGVRKAILCDLSPAATFISYNYNTPVDALSYELEASKILREIKDECAWMFSTFHNARKEELGLITKKLFRCKNPEECHRLLKNSDTIKTAIRNPKARITLGKINYVVWSDVFVCAECGEEIIYLKEAFDRSAGCLKPELVCPTCGAIVTKRQLERAWRTYYDQQLKSVVKQAKQVPIFLNYSINKTRFRKEADSFDLGLNEFIRNLPVNYWFPKNKIMLGDKTGEPIRFGITHIHHFYSERNLRVIAALWNRLTNKMKWLATSFLSRNLLKTNRFVINKHNPNGRINGPLTGTFYIPSEVVEQSGIQLFEGKILRHGWKTQGNIIATSSASNSGIRSNSIDYLFLDPPFGSNYMYSELNFVWESWLKVLTNKKSEAIENKTQQKGLRDYQGLMRKCFIEAHRVLKPGRWMTVEFSNTRASVWNAIQTALQEAGFVVANVSMLDKTHAGIKAMTNPTNVKQDLIISAYKPNGGLEKRFLKEAGTEEGVWNFIRTHLRNLPVVKPRGGQLEFITERDPRILYDRAVAYYVRHGFPVPISSPEFQVGMAEKFPERDGMYFLPEQVAQYDKKRVQMEGLGQMSIWVEDERSAADWLRNYLKDKPSKYQDVQPEFFEQLNQSWKKWETKPELRALIDQYFLCYDGKGDVPPQIHAYLSTNFKDLRKLPADDPALRTKAKDCWYVPDPRKNVDVEMLRDKRLLEEFWTYLPPGYNAEAAKKGTSDQQQILPGMEKPQPKTPRSKKLKLIRTEAVRVGFKHCYQNKDYPTIIAVAHHIPDNVVNGDDQLQMIYDTAVTRSGGDF